MAKYRCKASFKDGSKGKDKDGKQFTKSFKKGEEYSGQFADASFKAGLLEVIPEAPKPAPKTVEKK